MLRLTFSPVKSPKPSTPVSDNEMPPIGLSIFPLLIAIMAIASRFLESDQLKDRIFDATGIFLGYTGTMKNVIYYDTKTKSIRTTPHVAFDELMSDCPDSERTPNARLLFHLRDGKSL